MQKDEYLFAYKHVISMERLVQEVRGLQTPDLYYEIRIFDFKLKQDPLSEL